MCVMVGGVCNPRLFYFNKFDLIQYKYKNKYYICNMNTHKLFTLIISMLLFTGLHGKNVCIVKNRIDANVCVNRTYNRAVANYVIVLSKNRHESGSNVWVITDQKDAELKVYISDTPEKIKVFFSENKADGTKHTNHLHNRNTPGVKKSAGGVQKPF